MAGSVSPNSNPTVVSVHPLSPVRPNLLSLVNRLLPVLHLYSDWFLLKYFVTLSEKLYSANVGVLVGHVVGLVLSIRSLLNHAQSIRMELYHGVFGVVLSKPIQSINLHSDVVLEEWGRCVGGTKARESLPTWLCWWNTWLCWRNGGLKGASYSVSCRWVVRAH
ncbi:hypothetical protein GQ457_06G017190 [Hibiscus cannabinus]